MRRSYAYSRVLMPYLLFSFVNQKLLASKKTCPVPSLRESTKKFLEASKKNLLDSRRRGSRQKFTSTVYSPFNNIELAEKRRNKVLERMYKMHYIDKETMKAAQSEKIKLTTMPRYYTLNKAPYFCDYVMRELEHLGFSEQEIRVDRCQIRCWRRILRSMMRLPSTRKRLLLI